MKKIFITLIVAAFATLSAAAQKYALVDMD